MKKKNIKSPAHDAATRLAQKKGEEILNGKESEKKIDEVHEKMDSMNKGPLSKVWDKVVAIWNGFISPDTPLVLKILLIGSLAYMVSPLDIVPDTIPVAGLLDDVAVVAWAFAELQKFISQVKPSVDKHIAAKTAEIAAKKAEELIDTSSLDCNITWMMIKNSVSFIFFIIAALIISIPEKVNNVEIFISSALVFALAVFYFVRWMIKFFRNIYIWPELLVAFNVTKKEFAKDEYKNKKIHPKIFLEHMGVEFAIFHNGLSSEDTVKNTKKNGFIKRKGLGWLLRHLPEDKRFDFMPCDRQLFNAVKPKVHSFIQKHILVFMVFLGLYVLGFTFFFRNMVLTTTIGMTSGEFFIFATKTIVLKIISLFRK